MLTVFYHVAVRSFRKGLAYRFDALANLFTSLLYLVLYLSIWAALYRARPEGGGGADLPTMQAYAVIGQLIFAVTFSADTRDELEDRVRNGDIALELMKPVPFPLRMLAMQVGYSLVQLLLRGLPTAALAFVALRLPTPQDPAVWTAFGVSLLLAIVVNFGIEFLIGSIAFFTTEGRGFHNLIHSLIQFLSGHAIPHWLFPPFLYALAAALPFRAVAYVPNAIFVGRIAGGEIVTALAGQLAWAAVMLLIVRWVWATAMAKIFVQGG